jgi:hypothetical protein
LFIRLFFKGFWGIIEGQLKGEIMFILIPVMIIAMVTSSGTIQETKEATPIKEFNESQTVNTAEDLLKGEIIEAVVYSPTRPLEPLQLKHLLYKVGFEGDQLKQAWAVVMKESTGRPMAHNQNSRTGDNSYGLFQINMIGSLGPARLSQFGLSNNEELFDPLTNARIAYIMSEGGKDWSAWNGMTRSTQKWMQEFPN